MATLSLMGGATFLIGLLPAYASLGFWAPLGMLWAPVTAVLGTLFSEIFRTGVRYTGITLGYQLGAAVAGGTAPLVATALLLAYGGSSTPISIYMIVTGLISVVAVTLARPASEQ